MPSHLSPAAETAVKRVLDREARRLLDARNDPENDCDPPGKRATGRTSGVRARSEGLLSLPDGPIGCEPSHMQMLTQLRDEPGRTLEQRRLAAGLSRERLGAAAGGIASTTIVRIEHGTVTPQPRTLAALLAALDEAERGYVGE